MFLDMARTLRVYTKCDVKESDEQHQKLRSKIKNAAVELQQGNRFAPHFVAVRNYEGKAVSAELEIQNMQETFSLSEEDLSVVGYEALAKRLEPLLSERIQENIQSLRQQINQGRVSAKDELDSIGSQPRNLAQVVGELEKIVMLRLKEFETKLSKIILEFSARIKDTQSEAHDKMKVNEAFEKSYTVFTSPFFQGEAAFQARVEDLYELWKPISGKLVEDVSKLVNECSNLAVNFKGENSSIMSWLSDHFQNAVKHECHTAASQIKDKLNKEMQKELLKERYYGTINESLASKFDASINIQESHIKTALASLQQKDFNAGLTTRYNKIQESLRFSISDASMQSSVKLYENNPCATLNGSLLLEFNQRSIDTITSTIVRCLEARNQKLASSSIKTKQQERVGHAVAAYWDIMHQKFIDNVLSVVRDVALRGLQEWVQPDGLRMALSDQDMDVESELTSTRRATLKSVIELMSNCEEELNGIDNGDNFVSSEIKTKKKLSMQ